MSRFSIDTIYGRKYVSHYGLNYNQGRISIECLLDYPIESKIQAKMKYKKVIKLSAQGMGAGLFDASKGIWIGTCNNGKNTPKMTKYLNEKRFSPSLDKTYYVASVPL